MSLVDGLLPEADAVNDADHSSQLKRIDADARFSSKCASRRSRELAAWRDYAAAAKRAQFGVSTKSGPDEMVSATLVAAVAPWNPETRHHGSGIVFPSDSPPQEPKVCRLFAGERMDSNLRFRTKSALPFRDSRPVSHDGLTVS